MAQSLDKALSGFSDAVRDAVRSRKSISVTTHIDCDGLTSGGIITRALIRAGANVTVRTSKEFSPEVAESLGRDQRDLHIVTDLGGGFGADMDRVLGDGWFVLDHHEIPEEETDNPRVINAWKYGIDGGADVCAGGMAYLAAVALDERNEDLSATAVVSALGDRQDGGEKKAFTGKNAEIAETAKGLGLLNAELDLLLVGRETRPLADALAFTSHPFIEGLAWNRDACYALLHSAKIEQKVGGRWRVPAELTDDEKKALIESIARFASENDPTGAVSGLIGYAYTFPREDGRSFLRDGREFSTMLNSCGRVGRPGVGIAVCMGDRNRTLREARETLIRYRRMIRNCMSTLGNEAWRVSDGGNLVMINGEGEIPETMTGTIASIIAGSPKNAGKIVVLRTDGERTGEEEGGGVGGYKVKFSARKSPGCRQEVSLSGLMREGARRCGGIGGGHDAAAGARITRDKLDVFLGYLDASIAKVPGPDNPERDIGAEGRDPQERAGS